MTPHDLDRAYADYDLYRRALARCITSGSHFDADDAPPCSGCLLATANRLAIPAHVSALASASPSEVTRLLAEGADGAAGCAGSAASLGLAAPPSNSSPPPASHAEGGGTGHRYGPEESMP